MNFHLSRNGQLAGPFSAEQIQTFLTQGTVAASDLAWTEGWPGWVPISNVPSLIAREAIPPVFNPPPMPSPQAQLPTPVFPSNPPTPISMSSINTTCMSMHLSQLTGLLVPIAGFIVPIVIWQVNKDKHPLLDKHGRIVANWIISSLIYDLVTIALMGAFIGLLIAIPLLAIEIIFPVIGAIKASRGEIWNYPLNIPFFAI
jgi:uncharacterized Tic20 family protein